jgi:DNA-binding transcriptional LysR family regulator
VVEAGNFTKAADTLDLPNATVTRLIQALEQHLQVRLLQRTTRTVTVTPEGATYYERVVRADGRPERHRVHGQADRWPGPRGASGSRPPPPSARW